MPEASNVTAHGAIHETREAVNANTISDVPDVPDDVVVVLVPPVEVVVVVDDVEVDEVDVDEVVVVVLPEVVVLVDPLDVVVVVPDDVVVVDPLPVDFFNFAKPKVQMEIVTMARTIFLTCLARLFCVTIHVPCNQSGTIDKT